MATVAGLGLCFALLSGCSGDTVALPHGAQQVRQMLADRPLMATTPDGAAITPDDRVWQWAARQFDGEATGFRIFWESRPPDKIDEYDAESGMRDDGQGFIRIRPPAADGRASRAKQFEDLWHSAAFELNNMRRTKDFLAIYERAVEGDVDRDTWVHHNAELEHAAVLDTVAFHRSIWKPWSAERGFRSNRDVWRLDTPRSYAEWIALYTDPDGYPWSFWGAWYDDNLRPYLIAIGRWPVVPAAAGHQPAAGRAK